VEKGGGEVETVRRHGLWLEKNEKEWPRKSNGTKEEVKILKKPPAKKIAKGDHQAVFHIQKRLQKETSPLIRRSRGWGGRKG